MERTLTPFQFFNLPDYLQRKILIEDLDFQSVQNLCDAANVTKDTEVKKFFENLCGSAEVWRDKFQHNFPRSFSRAMREAIENGWVNDAEYWKSAYLKYKVYLEDDEVSKLLLSATQLGDIEKVRELLALGVDPNVQDEYGKTALVRAITRNQPEIVKELLEAGADVNIVETLNGNTALFYAVDMVEDTDMEDTGIIQMILDFGADVNHQNKYGNKALIGAEDIEIVEMLIRAGLDIDYQNEEGGTLLMLASKYGNAETIKFLLSVGADVNRENKYGETPLIFAAKAGESENAEVLLRVGANIDHQDDDGDTALITALYEYMGAKEPDLDTIFMLIKYKPNPDLRNLNGITAIDIAEKLKLKNILNALLYLRHMRKSRLREGFKKLDI